MAQNLGDNQTFYSSRAPDIHIHTTNKSRAMADCTLDGSLWTSLIFFFLIAILAIFGNGLVCAAFATNKRLRILTNYYVVSLAVSDILVGSFNIPLWMYIMKKTHCKSEVDNGFYEAFIIFDILCGTASIWNMTAISIDRFAAVVYPTVYKHRMKSTKLAGWTILGVWIFSLFVALLRLAYQKFNYAMFVVTLSFFIPLLLILFSYGNIYRVVRYRAKWTGSVLIEIKLARTLSIVIGAFILCWGPFFIINIVTYYCGHKTCDYNVAIKVIKWLQYASACINPIIYTIRNREFRFTFHKLIFRCNYRNGKYVFNPQEKLSSGWGCCQLGGPIDVDFGESRSRYPTYTEEAMLSSSRLRSSTTPTKVQGTTLAFDNLSSSQHMQPSCDTAQRFRS